MKLNMEIHPPPPWHGKCDETNRLSNDQEALQPISASPWRLNQRQETAPFGDAQCPAAPYDRYRGYKPS